MSIKAHTIKSIASSSNSTGYGPSRAKSRLYFDGIPKNYPIWETRFLNYLYTQDENVYTAIQPKLDNKGDRDNFAIKNRRS